MRGAARLVEALHQLIYVSFRLWACFALVFWWGNIFDELHIHHLREERQVGCQFLFHHYFHGKNNICIVQGREQGCFQGSKSEYYRAEQGRSKVGLKWRRQAFGLSCPCCFQLLKPRLLPRLHLLTSRASLLFRVLFYSSCDRGLRGLRCKPALSSTT